MDESYQRALEFLNKEAEDRTKRNEGKPSERQLSDDYNLVGMAGEWAFAKICNQMPDFSVKQFGDSGVDFIIKLRFTVDVKTARSASRLLVEQGKVAADIYVLAQYIKDKEAELLGWEWGKKIAQVEPYDTGRGIINHAIPAEFLRPMEELLIIMER